MDVIPKSEILKEVGHSRVFNEEFNHIDVKSGVQLKNTSRHTNRCNKILKIGTSSEDPILKEYADKKEGNVFVTDQILSFILAAPKSVYPWDLVLNFKNGIIFIDKRNESGIDDLHCGN
jgi:translation initiation factor 3 subunit D